MTRWPSIIHWKVRNWPGLAEKRLSLGTWKRNVFVSCVCCSICAKRRFIGSFVFWRSVDEAARTGIPGIRADSSTVGDCFLFLSINAHWTRHTPTTKGVASLSPRLPGFNDRRSSENAGMDTSTNEITKIARPSTFSNQWFSL